MYIGSCGEGGLYCKERKGKRGGHVHIGSCGEGEGMYCTYRKRKERRAFTYVKLW